MKFRQFERMGSHLDRLESSGDFGDSPFESPSDLWMDAENVSGRRTRKSTKHSKSAWCSWKTADNVQADWIGSKHCLVPPKMPTWNPRKLVVQKRRTSVLPTSTNHLSETTFLLGKCSSVQQMQTICKWIKKQGTGVSISRVAHIILKGLNIFNTQNLDEPNNNSPRFETNTT